MGTRSAFFNRLIFFAAALALAASPTLAAPQKDIAFKGMYEARYAGLPIGKAGIEISQTANAYQGTSDITTAGLVSLFSKHTSHTTVKASGKNHHYARVAYATHYRTKKKKKSVTLEYQNGAIVQEDVQPPENREKRPAVPDELRTGSHDPLSFLLVTRGQLIEALKHDTDKMTSRIYDGRRLMQADLTIKGRRKISIGGKVTPVIAVSAKRSLLAGFTKSEMEDYSPSEAPLRIYFSDDDRLMPVRLELPVFLGTITATLAKECGANESCLLGVKE